jgi:hypothetical protein
MVSPYVGFESMPEARSPKPESRSPKALLILKPN